MLQYIVADSRITEWWRNKTLRLGPFVEQESQHLPIERLRVLREQAMGRTIQENEFCPGDAFRDALRIHLRHEAVGRPRQHQSRCGDPQSRSPVVCPIAAAICEACPERETGLESLRRTALSISSG